MYHVISLYGNSRGFMGKGANIVNGETYSIDVWKLVIQLYGKSRGFMRVRNNEGANTRGIWKPVGDSQEAVYRETGLRHPEVEKCILRQLHHGNDWLITAYPFITRGKLPSVFYLITELVFT